MSVEGLCGVFIPGWVGVGKWQSQQEIVCTYGVSRSPAGSGGGGCIYVRVRVGLLLCIGWLSPLFEFIKQWFP